MEEGKKKEWQRKVCKYLFVIMSNSIFPSASLLSRAIMESLFAWWQGNRPALFRLVSAIMKKYHQPWMKAWHSVFRDTRQIITIDCYLGTAKEDRGRKSKAWWTGRAQNGIKSQFSLAAVVDFFFLYACFTFLPLRSWDELLLQMKQKMEEVCQTAGTMKFNIWILFFILPIMACVLNK